MFTGIVTAVGEVEAVERRPGLVRLTISSRYDAAGVEIGASIATFNLPAAAREDLIPGNDSSRARRRSPPEPASRPAPRPAPGPATRRLHTQ